MTSERASMRVAIGLLSFVAVAAGCAGSEADGVATEVGDVTGRPPEAANGVEAMAGASAEPSETAAPSAGNPGDPTGQGDSSSQAEPSDDQGALPPQTTGQAPPAGTDGTAGAGSAAPSTAGAGAPIGPATAAGSDAVAPTAATGDPDGSGEIVSIPEVGCGPAAGLDAFVSGTGIPGPGTPNIQIGGRDVVLSYPCDKREGAHVTFLLNLHGTMPEETLKLYQHGYFSAHKLVTSHNLIVATPRSVSAAGQWDNGAPEDIPHLYEVVDWVYDKFSKYQITGMWIGGHSWGAMFAKRFVCDPMFTDKVRGVIGMSGGGIGPACADRISQIHTAGELEGGAALNPDQSAVAAAHGCDAMAPIEDIGNGQMLYDWPNCDPGWVHFNFVMGAHDHITAIDDPVVEYIVDAMKSTEL